MHISFLLGLAFFLIGLVPAQTETWQPSSDQVQTPIEMAFFVPGHKNTHGPLSVSHIEMETEIHDPVIVRLEKILTSWLQLPVPYPIAAWAKVVSEACQKVNLRIGEIGKRPVVSDLIRERFPQSCPSIACSARAAN